jgi:hypothetical protein
MQYQPISATGEPTTCIFCEGTIPRGAAVWRAGHPHHAGCLIRTLTRGNRARQWRTLRRGLLPAGKGRNARRKNLYKNLYKYESATAEVGGDA